MRPISLHVEDEVYRDLKTIAERTGRPVAEPIRDAMSSEYLARCTSRPILSWSGLRCSYVLETRR